MLDQFFRAIKWNIASIILYKLILFLHQGFLFATIDQTEYGILGTIFSTIYFFVPVLNFGFDYTLFAFFKRNRSSEESSFILQQYLNRAVILLCIIAVASIMYLYRPASHNNMPTALFVTCLALFFIESIKHSLLTHAHIFHLSRQIALYENISLIAYITAVWSYVWINGETPRLLFFLPLLVVSTIEALCITRSLYSAYHQLPESTPITNLTNRAFYKECGFNYINQLARALFSPNFLILSLAATVGFHKTGYIKFITTAIIFLYSVFHRSIQMSGGALLAGISHMPVALIKKTFNAMTTRYAHVILIAAVYFSALLYFYSQSKGFSGSADLFSTHTIIIFFCFISFMEYGTLTYETLFITQKHGRELAWINAANITAATVILPLLYWFPNPLFLFCLCVFKIFTVGYIVFRARHIWDIDLSVDIQLETMIVHLAIALALVNYCL
jgi:hypothetical protein